MSKIRGPLHPPGVVHQLGEEDGAGRGQRSPRPRSYAVEPKGRERKKKRDATEVEG